MPCMACSNARCIARKTGQNSFLLSFFYFSPIFFLSFPLSLFCQSSSFSSFHSLPSLPPLFSSAPLPSTTCPILSFLTWKSFLGTYIRVSTLPHEVAMCLIAISKYLTSTHQKVYFSFQCQEITLIVARKLRYLIT